MSAIVAPLVAGSTAVAGAAASAASGAATGITNPLAALGDANRLFANLGSAQFWKRILTGTLGVWLIWIGILIILASSRAARDAAQSISKVVVK